MKKETTFKKIILSLNMNNKEYDFFNFHEDLVYNYTMKKRNNTKWENMVKTYKYFEKVFNLENYNDLSEFESFLYGMTRVFEREFTFTQTHDLDLVRTSFNA